MEFVINDSLPRIPHKKHWQFCVGSGHALLALRTAKKARTTMASIAIRAIISPSSSLSRQKTISVSAANRFLHQPFPAPTPCAAAAYGA